MSTMSIILVLIIAFLAGVDSVLDIFQFYQPIVVCTLIGLVCGQLTAGLVLGGTLQMIVLGWANVGAAMAPDTSLAGVASAIILMLGNKGVSGVNTAVAMAIPLAVAGLMLTMLVRTLSVSFVHFMDAAAKKANFRQVEMWHYIAMICQGLRVAIPAGLLLFIPAHDVQALLNAIPAWLNDGMTIGGGLVVAVGYAMVINMMATKEVWPFFIIGFVIAAINQLTLLALGLLGVTFTLIYLNLDKHGNNNGGDGNSNTGDPLGDILDDY